MGHQFCGNPSACFGLRNAFSCQVFPRIQGIVAGPGTLKVQPGSFYFKNPFGVKAAFFKMTFPVGGDNEIILLPYQGLEGFHHRHFILRQ